MLLATALTFASSGSWSTRSNGPHKVMSLASEGVTLEPLRARWLWSYSTTTLVDRTSHSCTWDLSRTLRGFPGSLLGLNQLVVRVSTLGVLVWALTPLAVT